MSNTSKKRIFAFIDSQNLNLGVRNDIYNKSGKKIYTGWALDFRKFSKYLKDKYRVEKSFLFIGKIPGNKFLYKMLKSCGYTLVFKPTLPIKKEKGIDVKGNVDAELVLHAMIEFDNYDSAVIVTGDGDFQCLAKYLKSKGKLRKVIVPNKVRYSSLLRKFSNYIDFVSTKRGKLEYISN